MVTIDLIVKFQLFLIILARMLAMFMVAPFFSSRIIPMRVKGIFAFFIAVILFPMISTLGIKPELSIIPFLLQIAGEVLIGLAIGFLVAIFFTATQFAGQLFSVQMGLGISMVFDPQAQVQMPILGQLLSIFAIMVFLLVGAHRHLITAVYQSYFTLPALSIGDAAPIFAKGVAGAFVKMFGAAILIALPMITTALLISVTLGILAKTAPQLNVLMMGFPIQIIVGFTVLIMAVPFIYGFIANLISESLRYMSTVIMGF